MQTTDVTILRAFSIVTDKARVYFLSKYINEAKTVIPSSIATYLK